MLKSFRIVKDYIKDISNRMKRLDNIRFIVKVDEQIENDNTDVIINWSDLSIRRGSSPHFNNILKKAGSQTYSSYLIYDNGSLKHSDAFAVVAGLLNCELLINSIIPPHASMYNTNFMFIAKCLKTYKEELDNNCRFISTYIPNYQNINEIIQFMILYFEPLKFIKEVRLFCSSTAEKQIIESTLAKFC